VYKYIIGFVLVTPLIGIWLVEGGEYAGSIGVAGYPNGATAAFAAYALGLAAVAWLCGGRSRQPARAMPARGASARFHGFAGKLLIFDVGFLLVFLFGFGAQAVWFGDVDKGEFRVSLGGFGFIPTLMTRFIVPALFAYATLLYSRTPRRGLVRWHWIANLIVVSLIGASWGFKSSAMLLLMPGLLLLFWRVRPLNLLVIALAFCATIAVSFLIFDARFDLDADIQARLLSRITVLQGDTAWHIWGLYSSGDTFPDYAPTLLVALGDKVLSLMGLSQNNQYEWMLYHYDWMLTYLAGVPLDAIENGYNLTGTPFAEGLIAGGIAGVALFVIIGGILVGAMHRFLDRALRLQRDTQAATYFCLYVFPWLNGGSVVQLFHIALVINVGCTLAALSVMRRRWVFSATRQGAHGGLRHEDGIGAREPAAVSAQP
jgi:hypothetical protein